MSYNYYNTDFVVTCLNKRAGIYQLEYTHRGTKCLNFWNWIKCGLGKPYEQVITEQSESVIGRMGDWYYISTGMRASYYSKQYDNQLPIPNNYQKYIGYQEDKSHEMHSSGSGIKPTK